jgi:4-hydroxy-tetrahydrodipicolinate reductase
MSGPAVALIGMGKMGRAVEELVRARGWPVVATLTVEDAPITRAKLGRADVAIEFTDPVAAPANVRACLAAGCPVVVGTTGWYAELPMLETEVTRAGGAMLWDANFSIGAHVLVAAGREAARVIGASAAAFDAHIVETHHAAKKDAPSGTAHMLARAVGDALGRPVPVTSVRVGHVPGTHELVFDGAYEQLRLEHVARDRRVFAEGALIAAAWLVAEPRRGVFTMRDVLAGARA